jgi:dTDP-4-dehydrorhamnose reductase
VSLDRVLITGGGGQLASDLEELLSGRSDVHAPGRSELDVTDDQAVEAAFAGHSPDIVFNCAAFHNLDVCEREVDHSFEVNARAVKRLGERCREAGATLVHLSTNYVFDGRADRPYREDDLPAPRSVYAISKLAGEHAALAYAPNALVVRSSGLYGLHGSGSKGGNFVTRAVARAREQGELRMVADQRLNPTFTADLAAALLTAVESDVRGLLHLTNSGECSWHEFTVEIMRLAGIDVPIEAIETTVPPGGVDRPLNGGLDRPAADDAGLEPLRPWQAALAEYVERAGLRAQETAQPS